MVAVVVAIPVWAYGVEPMRGIARLEPGLLENYERLSRIAAITGDRAIADHAIEALVRDESAAVVGAMEAAGLIHVHPDQRQATVAALAAYARRVVAQ
jgi:hypothetical protein